MTDDELVKHLRSAANKLVNYAGDRIEALQAQNLQLSGMCYDLTAERDRWQQAFAAQSAKLQIALDVGGEPVRAALKGETT